MSKKLKQWMAGEVRASVGASEACLVLGWKTLTGETSSALRSQLRKSKVELTVIHNRVARHALADGALKDIRPLISGPTALATGGQDAAALSKAVMEGVKGRPGFVCRGGFVEGRVVTGEEVRILASLPTRGELLSMIAAVVVQPVTDVAFGIDAILAGVARAVEAVREQKSKEPQPPPEPVAASGV